MLQNHRDLEGWAGSREPATVAAASSIEACQRDHVARDRSQIPWEVTGLDPVLEQQPGRPLEFTQVVCHEHATVVSCLEPQ